MDTIEKRKLWIMCEICYKEGATELKSGVYNGVGNIWMVCKKCVKEIKDFLQNNFPEKSKFEI